VGAERGAIFLKKDNGLKTAANRNMETHQISSDTFKPQMKIIETVFATGRECIKKGIPLHTSEKKNICSIGWLGCFPIRLKARVMGVIYVDCKFIRLDLSKDEVRLLRIISNQAAVALDNLKAYEEISDLKNNLEAEAHYYRQSYTDKRLLENMIGRCRSFKKLVGMIKHVAASDTTVMLIGETGVGKDMAAQAIHQLSDRANGPFIAVNLASLSPELIASELFGHEKGAFTGADHRRQGRFELASEGTLFLDDIDAFSLDIQAKMLRVLETKEFERVGGSRTLKTSFRLVTASNRKIEELVKKGLFRSDFYYRLNVFPIKIPPLRERREDIPILARHFMEIFQRKTGKHFNGIDGKAIQRLLDYKWPGNVRELRHVIERAVLMSNGKRLRIPPLDSPITQPDNGNGRFLSLREMQIRHIVEVLKISRGKVSGNGGAAELLDVKPTTLYAKMKRFGLERGDYKPKGR
jgi:transcriptional regulator with GAF, ATPase, and Fis domain